MILGTAQGLGFWGFEAMLGPDQAFSETMRARQST